MSSRLTRGFFHRDLSGIEAEKILQEKGVTGSFLVRPSTTKADAYVLSVRRADGKITHIRIQRTNDGFDLGERQECFSTLYDMIEHYRQNVGELREKNNEIIELTVPILAQMPTLEKYYHGPISHGQTESILNSYDQIGVFLVRDSETVPGDYVICVKTSQEIANIKIKCINGEWFLDGKGRREQIDRFKSLDELINFYLKHNILVATNGAAFRLSESCAASWFHARDIHQRCEYLARLVTTQHGQRTGFSLEFELLNQQSECNSANYHKKHGDKAENRARNRFKNILPYDETRVILRNYSITDYINANRIRAPSERIPREYIATQGPLSSTINDFWHMVQQEMVRCIVMITRETEGMKSKCARYWPELHATKIYGSVTVENLNESNHGPSQTPTATPRAVRSLPSASYQAQQSGSTDDDCCYRLRTLRVSTEDGRSWDILHWQYLAWGDHGSPLLPNQHDQSQFPVLMEFFEKISRANQTTGELSPAPMVVHCSAGIGRSGATIAIDILLNRIRSEGLDTEIEIPGLISHIRSQRSGLVQTERQYEFIYRVIEYFVEQQTKTMSNSQMYMNLR